MTLACNIIDAVAVSAKVHDSAVSENLFRPVQLVDAAIRGADPISSRVSYHV